uniref:7TM_GPCR_Srx domain-containing protein n=1 Tax=Steinernema glaseri TaxID=37863 RepID=A0A1I7ZSP0_9BILA
MHYQKIFNRKLCIFVAFSAACQALSVVLLYYRKLVQSMDCLQTCLVIPCQNVGYSPRFYSQVFIKCSPDLDRDYSVLAYYLNKICFIMACCGTAAVNFSTFCKIMFIRMSSNARFNNKDFKRDVRLFTLGVIQDILMMIIVLSIVLFNNEKNISLIGILLSYDGLIFIYMFNTLSMGFCNPECRRFLFKSNRSTVSSMYITSNSRVTGTTGATALAANSAAAPANSVAEEK